LIRRLLLAALALLAAVPSHAQDAPAWVGVWEGKVGTAPVRACLDGYPDTPGRGSYYYLSRLEPISLSEDDGEGGWTERAPGSDVVAQWAFAELSATHMRGTWRQGTRSLAFDLSPVRWTEGEWGGPCSSDAFLGPRAAGGKVLSEPATLEGWAYIRQTYQAPAHFADDVAIETFTFAPAQPGDEAILAALTAHLPKGTFADDYLQCLGGAISSLGYDGQFDETLHPTLVTRAFLVVEEESGTFCGGAHPNYVTMTRTYDRQSGEEIDLFDWLGQPPAEGEISTLPERLHALVLARWPADADADEECRDLAEHNDYWSLGLARDGLVFRPDFPHAMTPCEEPVTVEWQVLAPFLDAEGKSGLARLREK
jgi:hypothetical protein